MKTTFRKLVTLLLAVVMLLSIVGCGGNNSNSGNSGSSGNSDTQNPGGDTGDVQYATEFTFAIGSEIQLLDPGHSDDNVTSYILNQLYYPLFTIGEDGKMVNQACTSMDISDDGLVYTLHLTENNYWSDGEKVTAEHYVYGMKRSVGLGTADSYYSYFISDYVRNAKAHSENLDDVADMDDIGIRAVDDYTIEITLTAPCPYYEDLLGSGVFYPLRPEYATEHDSAWANDTSVPVNGAFYPVSISTEEVVMKKNPYFGNAGQVVFETLHAKIIADQDAQLMAFQTGEIDFASSVNAEVTKIYEGKPELIIAPTVTSTNVCFNTYTNENEALLNPVVRRALALAIDREELVKALDDGGASYAMYGIVPKGFAGINGDFREEQDAKDQLVYYDPDEAKALLAQEGYDESNPLSFSYFYNSNLRNDLIAEVIREQWGRIGVECTLETAEGQTFFDDRNNGFYQSARLASSADWLDPTAYLNIITTAIHPVVTYGDATFDAMMAEADQLSGDVRMQKLHDAEEYAIRNMTFFLPLIGSASIALAKDGLTGAWTNPQNGWYFWYAKMPA